MSEVNMDLIPKYFKAASSEERIDSLARAVVSMTWDHQPGTFGEQWNHMARFALRELERENG